MMLGWMDRRLGEGRGDPFLCWLHRLENRHCYPRSSFGIHL